MYLQVAFVIILRILFYTLCSLHKKDFATYLQDVHISCNAWYQQGNEQTGLFREL